MRLIDMAKSLIMLSGLEPGEDIEIKVTGLKPGEKMHEELMEDPAGHGSSSHPDIMSLRGENKPLENLVDLFVREPMPFEALWSRSVALDIGGVEIREAGIDDLIAMKRAVGRPQDRDDVATLEALKRE